MNDEERKRLMEAFADRHRGSRNAHRISIIEDDEGNTPSTCDFCGGDTVTLTAQSYCEVGHQEHWRHVARCAGCVVVTGTDYRCHLCAPITESEYAATVLERGAQGLSRPPELMR